ncbi:HK97 gp10 family phage protein [Nonomuraea terrae]|uniref:HK97 gp10 family phage protein n=1 Tax=Nonomuraea terrae TaxID=2530383 RepID=A0A4V2YNJ4_9ACTN|nr:HK97 gp10 family phage protein [Nonomuraea terrae]TDD54587.1 HK97 gp10 family phage protein [Nonomuraea terrae]
MAVRARFRGNYKGVGRLLASKQMQDEMESRAKRLQSACEADAPRDTGAYSQSFRVETGVRQGRTPRAESKVINDDPAAPYVEWGTSRTPRHRVMGRAAGAE